MRNTLASGVKKKKHVGNFHTRIILTLFYFSDNCK